MANVTFKLVGDFKIVENLGDRALTVAIQPLEPIDLSAIGYDLESYTDTLRLFVTDEDCSLAFDSLNNDVLSHMFAWVFDDCAVYVDEDCSNDEWVAYYDPTKQGLFSEACTAPFWFSMLNIGASLRDILKFI